MGKNGGPPPDTFWKDVAIYSTFSLNLAFTVGGGFYLGYLLDRHYGTAPRWILAGFLIGLGVGLYTLFSLASRFGRKG